MELTVDEPIAGRNAITSVPLDSCPELSPVYSLIMKQKMNTNQHSIVHYGILLLLLLWTSVTALPALQDKGDGTRQDEPDLEKLDQLITSGKYEEARKKLNNIPEDGSDQARKQFRLLMRILRQTGSYSRGIKKCKSFLESVDDPGVRLALARFEKRKGLYEKALKRVNTVIENHESHLAARALRVELYRTTGKYEKIKSEFQFFKNYAENNEEELDDVSGLYHLSRGLWLYANWKGNTDLVKKIVGEYLFRANKKNSKHLPMKTFWGSCYRDKGAIPDAIQTYKEVLKINENYAAALVSLARIGSENKRRRKKTGSPKKLAKKALETNPNYLPARLVLAKRHLIKKKFKKFRKQLERALEINENSPGAHGLNAAYHLLQNNREKYKTARKKALSVNPKYGRMDATIAGILEEEMEFQRAQKYYNQATELNPNLWGVQESKGINLLRLGQERKGKKILEKAYKNNPFNVKVVNTLELLDLFEEEFETYRDDGYLLRVHESEAEYARYWIQKLLKKSIEEMSERYQFELDDPVVVEIFHHKGDFSVRTVGIEGIGAKGACFGKVTMALSPLAKDAIGPYNWGSTLWHEMGHAYALQLSEWRVPRWFTEALSVYEETLGPRGWEREIALKVNKAMEAGKLPTLMEIDSGEKRSNFAMYQYGRKIIEFIVNEYGFEGIVKILKAYRDGKETNEAFASALGDDLETVEGKLRKWIRNWIQGFKLRNRISKEERKSFQEQVENGEEKGKALAMLALYHFQQKNTKKARQKAKEAIEENGDLGMPYVVLAGLERRDKVWNEARKFYQKALDNGADDFRTLMRFGATLEKTGDTNRAITMYEKARKTFPRYVGDGNPYLKLFDLYKNTNQGRKALESLKGYCQRAHKDFHKNRELAEYLVKLERWEEARNVLERLIWINYKDLKVQTWLADSYWHLSEWHHAHAAYLSTVGLLKTVHEEKGGANRLLGKYLLKAAKASEKLNKTERALREAKRAQNYDRSNKNIKKFINRISS